MYKKIYMLIVLVSLLIAHGAHGSPTISTGSGYGDFIGFNDYGLFTPKGYADASALASAFLPYATSPNYGYGNQYITESDFTTETFQHILQLQAPVFASFKDNYFFYISTHGAKQTDELPNRIWVGTNPDQSKNLLTDIELAQYFKEINWHFGDVVNKIVIIDSCYSGGFIDELKSINNMYIITSATAETESFSSRLTGRSFFSMAMEKFVTGQNGKPFTFDDLSHYMADPYSYKDWFNTMSYAKFDDGLTGEPHLFTAEDINVSFYSSPVNNPVPEPSTVILTISGMIFVIAARRRYR